MYLFSPSNAIFLEKIFSKCPRDNGGSCSQDKKARSAQSPLLRHSSLVSGGVLSLPSNQLNTSCCSLPWTWVPSCSAHNLVIPLIICWSPPSWLRPPHLPLCSVVHRCCLAMDLILDPTLILLLASGGLLACLLVLWILRLSGNTNSQLGWCCEHNRWQNRLDQGRVWMSSFSESYSEVDFSPRWHTAMATPTLVCSCHVQIF